ncbi:MAG: RIP metalloprotease RseP [Desulfovibrionaceae bacterium]|nr:RIP metalloprotease RseP [Desulfovibrionaceae bacterium]MBF0513567.1 RIP metalloprotease RseP [Desulfovibrionaceae bacterium]
MAEKMVTVVVVLGGLIFIHELGHYLLARLLRIGVRTFSLGFGPKLLGFRRGMTEYRLSAVPLGGYVQLVGQDPGDEIPEGFRSEHRFDLRPAWQRALVVAAGPSFNFLIAWLIIFGLFLFQGRYELSPVVGQVQAGGPAEAAGFLPGDRIESIGGVPTRTWQDLRDAIAASGGSPLAMSIRREGAPVRLEVTPRVMTRKNIFGEDVSTSMIAVAPSGEIVVIPFSAFEAMGASADKTAEVVRVTGQGIWKLIVGVVPLDTIGGPIMIAQLISQQVDKGAADVLSLAAFLSVNLGLLNLLPIPVLDGGHILFYILEGVRRRPVNMRWQQITTRFGLALLLSIMALAVYNDMHRTIMEMTSDAKR